MKASSRTILAFLGAPAIAPMLLGVVAASMRPEGEGPTWIAYFRQYFAIAAFVSYAVSYTLGTLTFVILRAWRKESVLGYTVIGAAVGVLWGLLIALNAGPLVVCAYLGLLGGSVGLGFALIRGVSKKNQPNKAPEPTP